MTNPNVKKGGGGGDMVMESRHLIGIFLGVVVLCGVFFTLGWVMGRTQADAGVHAASIGKDKVTPPGLPAAQPNTKAQQPPAVPGPSEWTFPAASEKKSPEHFEPAAKGANATSGAPAKPAELKSAPAAKAPGTKPSSKLHAPLMARGSIVLQVAALTREGDALALADALQQKEFPAFVLTPAEGGNLYRVQVGPYADTESAELAKRALLREGFKAILKR